MSQATAWCNGHRLERAGWPTGKPVAREQSPCLLRQAATTAVLKGSATPCPCGQKTHPYRNINFLASKVRVLIVHATVSFLNFLLSRERDIDSYCHSVWLCAVGWLIRNYPRQAGFRTFRLGYRSAANHPIFCLACRFRSGARSASFP